MYTEDRKYDSIMTTEHNTRNKHCLKLPYVAEQSLVYRVAQIKIPQR